MGWEPSPPLTRHLEPTAFCQFAFSIRNDLPWLGDRGPTLFLVIPLFVQNETVKVI